MYTQHIKYVTQAIRILSPSAIFTLKETENGIEVISFDGTKPSDEEIISKAQELQTTYELTQYSRDRATAYPNIADQLDMLWHAIDEGTLDKTSDFYTSLKAVKDEYPKP
jgi:hypothetical protein